MKFSNASKNIILISIIFIGAILTVSYGINVNSYLKSATDFFDDNTKVSEKQEVSLVKCIDGDTAKFKLNDDVFKARFLAIDTPETSHPQINSQSYGIEASEYTCNMLKKAHKIEIASENGVTNYDKYNRKLVWVWIDNELLQETLIEMGLAKVRYVYAKYHYIDSLIKKEQAAKEKKIGIWYDYNDNNYSNLYHYVTFSYGTYSEIKEVKEGELVEIINNPKKKGYNFTGWTYNNKLYDLSRPITKDISLEARFDK